MQKLFSKLNSNNANEALNTVNSINSVIQTLESENKSLKQKNANLEASIRDKQAQLANFLIRKGVKYGQISKKSKAKLEAQAQKDPEVVLNFVNAIKMPGANADEYERLMKKDPEKLQNLIQDDPDRFEEMQNDWLNAENIEEINIENIEETGEGFQNLSENRPDVLDQIRKKHPEKFNRMAEAWNKM